MILDYKITRCERGLNGFILEYTKIYDEGEPETDFAVFEYKSEDDIEKTFIEMSYYIANILGVDVNLECEEK